MFAKSHRKLFQPEESPKIVSWLIDHMQFSCLCSVAHYKNLSVKVSKNHNLIDYVYKLNEYVDFWGYFCDVRDDI